MSDENMVYDLSFLKFNLMYLNGLNYNLKI